MAKTTTNKSLRQDNPTKVQRRAAMDGDDAGAGADVPGASGQRRSGPRRPGRAASLRSSSQRMRSQLWRSIGKRKVKVKTARRTRR
jgi:hypothetical protein